MLNSDYDNSAGPRAVRLAAARGAPATLDHHNNNDNNDNDSKHNNDNNNT